MTFRFSTVCELLEKLERLESHSEPLRLPADRASARLGIFQSWFKSHRRGIDNLDTKGGRAFLSAVLPERRTDRVYGLQAAGLCKILCRQLGYGLQRRRDLHLYTEAGFGDLGACLERIFAAGGPPAHPPVSLEELDEFLNFAAASCRFSNPEIRAQQNVSTQNRDESMRCLYQRLSACEAKWCTRLILKDLGSVTIDDNLVLKSFHFLLPDLLHFQNCFEACLGHLKGSLAQFPSNPDPRSELAFRRMLESTMEPTVGIKVGRPLFTKAWSFDHCFTMIGNRRWVAERKYDGEYCEIHVDRSRSSNPYDCIKIFSKSGKDSTADRKGIHKTLVQCLGLGQQDCKIKYRAIILGELVVWSDRENSCMPFDCIRRYVTRSGTMIGADRDRPRVAHEHLAIAFFDLLVWDDDIVMRRGVTERREWLRAIYNKIPGRAIGVEWKELDFSQDPARYRKSLLQQFATSIAQRCEGLVLKPCEAPYFPVGDTAVSPTLIKLKKDYLDGFGDEADLAIVGASYNAQLHSKTRVQGLKITTFHIGCLVNDEQALRFGKRRKFRIVGTINAGQHCISENTLSEANTLAWNTAMPYLGNDASVPYDLEPLPNSHVSFLLREPLVFEILGSGFEKPSNQTFLMLRHARVKKLHQDRTWKDCVTFNGLQRQAQEAQAIAQGSSESQEIRRLVEKLERKAARKLMRERVSTLPASPSPSNIEKCTSAVNAVGTSSCALKRHYPSQNILQPNEATTPDWRRRATPQDSGSPRRSKKQMKTAPAYPGVSPEVISHVVPLRDITNSAALIRNGDDSRVKPRGKKSSLYSENPRAAMQPSSSPNLAWPCTQVSCSSESCAFAATAIHIAPCISRTPYVTDDLMKTHDCTVVSDLQEWNRDSFQYGLLGEVVSESQAYVDLRKIVLVERERMGVVKSLIEDALALNNGLFRERIEFYDWRALEQCRSHDKGSESLHEYLLGATRFDVDIQRAVFEKLDLYMEKSHGM